MEELRRELATASSIILGLQPLGSDRAAVLSPFTFDDGDGFPIVVQRADTGWRLSDEGGSAQHLSYADVDFDQGNRALLIERIARRHGLELEQWELSRELDHPPSVEDVLDFIHALVRVNDVDFLSRES